MPTTYEQLMDHCPFCGKKLDPMLKLEEREYHRSARCIRRVTEQKLQEERKRQPRLPGL